MDPLNRELAHRLETLQAQGLHRHLREVNSPPGARVEINGRQLLNFSSNDYLGLANHPALKEAAIRAIERYGAGSGASRLICGSLAPHHRLEEALAHFKQTEAALTFSSGYATALGTITALAGKGDVIVLDKLVHASIVDAARLSGATLRVFRHNDPEDLERILKWAGQRAGKKETERRGQILIAAESVYSMDGDLARLREIVDLKDRYGAWLMLDEAHATGIFGEHRRGLAEAQELSERVEIQMGTLGKAIGAGGGFICGRRPLIEYLINRARSFIFSTAPVPAAAAAATAGIELIQSGEGERRRRLLWARVDQLKNGLITTGWKLPPVQSPILPLILGDEAAAVSGAERLRESGILAPAIRYPTVARGKARLRLTLTAAHTPEDVDQLVAALQHLI